MIKDCLILNLLMHSYIVIHTILVYRYRSWWTVTSLLLIPLTCFLTSAVLRKLILIINCYLSIGLILFAFLTLNLQPVHIMMHCISACSNLNFKLLIVLLNSQFGTLKPSKLFYLKHAHAKYKLTCSHDDFYDLSLVSFTLCCFH